MKKTFIVTAVTIALVLLVFGAASAGDSCCSDRSIMTKGIQATHAALQKGDAERAVYVLEETAKITGIDLP